MDSPISRNMLIGIIENAKKGNLVCLTRLCKKDITFQHCVEFEIGKMARKHLGTERLRGTAQRLLKNIRKLKEQADSDAERAASLELEKRSAEATNDFDDVIYEKTVQVVTPAPDRTATFVSELQELGLPDISKRKNLKESDFQWARPVMMLMTARELKNFVDRNPKIEAISDELFRRHVEMEFPDDIQDKKHYKQWRLFHDVLTNWKAYNTYKANGDKY